jgi:cytochrome c oxidase subunit 2
MPPQQVAGYLFLACLVVLGAGFIIVGFSARKGPDDFDKIVHTGYKVRRWWFICLMIIGLIALGFTLPRLPYPLDRKPTAGTPVTVVHVTGQQWDWTITPDTVPANHEIEFEVTSRDVNHGFSVYSPTTNEIVANVQAMPGYVNDLYVTFTKPGVYMVRCLELCGLYHTSMISQITVTSGASTTSAEG